MTKAHDAGGGSAALPPVDLKHLHRYTLGNADVDREVLDLFRGQAPINLEQLRRAGDRKAWHEAAHALKGSARAIGAWRMGEIAERAERLATAPHGAECAPLVAELAHAFAAVEHYIGELAHAANTKTTPPVRA